MEGPLESLLFEPFVPNMFSKTYLAVCGQEEHVAQSRTTKAFPMAIIAFRATY